MTPAPYTEDTLVQQTTAEYLEQQLGWLSVYAHNNENFGPDSLLGRISDREVVLTRILRTKLAALNPGLPDGAYDDAIRQVTATMASQTMAATNREKYALLRDGVQVAFRNDRGERVRQRLKAVDFETPENNDFLCVRELWVKGDLYRRRADIIGFVNGLPLLFIECKNIHKNLKAAFEQNFSDYRDTVPHLFHHNAIVMFGNGEKARIGSITSRWEHFNEWKRLEEEAPGAVDMETLLKGVCEKRNFLDLIENFILFDETAGEPKKIIARNHQFLGVNRAISSVRDRTARLGKLGVFWHTQGSGKSYSMVMFTRKVHRKQGGNFTFLVLTDRDDLDTQIYKTFANCGVVNDQEPCRAASGRHLNTLLTQHKACINVEGVNAHRADRDAVNIIYKSLQQDRDQADISDIIRQLHAIVDEAIEVKSGLTTGEPGPDTTYDISRIDFDRLRKEFERSKSKRTTVQNLKQVVESRLRRLMERNPLRTDLQLHYEQIVAEYNREKDRAIIEQTFETLFRFEQRLDEEERRAVREGLDEEALAIFDLLRKPELTAKEIKRIKQVAVELLQTLKRKISEIDHWRDRETTRDTVMVEIHNFLYSDTTGLPEVFYTEEDVQAKTDEVFHHIYRVYPTIPSPFYA